MRAPANLLHRSTAVAAGPGEPSPSASPSSLPPPHPEQQQTAPVMAMDSDMVVILASLLCALVCVLGLALVSRCACGRRRSNSTLSSVPLPLKGLKKKAIDALPTVSFTTAGASRQSSSSVAACSSSLECAICLAEFTDGESVRVLPRCHHNFHVTCVDAWLRACATCPSCRAPIVVTTAQPGAGPTMVVVVAAVNNRCRRCGELEAPAGGTDNTFLP